MTVAELSILFLEGYFSSLIQHVLMKSYFNILHDNSMITDIEDDDPCPKNVRYFFPMVRAGITKGSSYVVVSRLKLSPTSTITASGGTFFYPDYPQVTITVPENAVATETRFSLQLKVGYLH